VVGCLNEFDADIYTDYTDLAGLVIRSVSFSRR
jgi:hypothetical protein